MQPLQPTLAKKPWSPFAIAVLTLLLSPAAGGVLHGLNCGRLGQGGLQRFTMSRNLLAGILLPLFLLFSRSGPYSLAASLFFASYFYKTQEEHFQDHLSQGGKKGSLLMAIVLSLLALLPVALLALGLSMALPK